MDHKQQYQLNPKCTKVYSISVQELLLLCCCHNITVTKDSSDIKKLSCLKYMGVLIGYGWHASLINGMLSCTLLTGEVGFPLNIKKFGQGRLCLIFEECRLDICSVSIVLWKSASVHSTNVKFVSISFCL